MLLSLSLVAGLQLVTPGDSDQSETTTEGHAKSRTNDGRHTLFGSTAQRRGAASTYADALRRTNNKFGGVDVVRVFHSALPAAWAMLRRDFNNKKLIVSFKANPKRITSGSLDRRLTRWFRNAPTNRRTFWTYYHEPEDNIEDGEFTARQYRAAWQHLARLAGKAHNPKLRSTMILMEWSLDPASGRHWRQYYAPKVIEVLGWDAYNREPGGYEPPRKMFRKIVRVSKRANRPFGVGELGSVLADGDRGRGRAKWLRRIGRYLAKHNATFVSYFDSDVVDGDFRLRDPASRRSWQHVVNNFN